MSTVIDEIDYGPLACLIGEWRGDDGMDVSPEDDGPDENPYYETIIFEACGDVDNVGTQFLSIVRYHQVVSRKSNDKVFHNETGYLTWDKDAASVTQSFSIPRGVTVVASGTGELVDGGALIKVAADESMISQTSFMQDNARTFGFTHEISVKGDVLSYKETTMVDIYGGEFEHTDENRLKRVSA